MAGRFRSNMKFSQSRERDTGRSAIAPAMRRGAPGLSRGEPDFRFSNVPLRSESFAGLPSYTGKQVSPTPFFRSQISCSRKQSAATRAAPVVMSGIPDAPLSPQPCGGAPRVYPGANRIFGFPTSRSARRASRDCLPTRGNKFPRPPSFARRYPARENRAPPQGRRLLS